LLHRAHALSAAVPTVHKSLVDTRWTRFKELVRGLLFYNTVYWRRASDGLKPPKLTPEERRSLAPPKNLDVIRPRVKPRARLDEVRRKQMIDELSRLRSKMPDSMARKPPGGGETAPATPVAVAPASHPAGAVTAAPAGRPATVHRTVRPHLNTPIRRRRRRSPRPAENEVPAPGLMARLFGKKQD
jgi:hypothetical protein